MKKHIAYFNYIDGIELSIYCIMDCSHSGDCEADVKRWLEDPELKKELSEISPDQLKQELDEYGAWSEEELKSHADNLQRILWLAAGNLMDEM